VEYIYIHNIARYVHIKLNKSICFASMNFIVGAKNISQDTKEGNMKNMSERMSSQISNIILYIIQHIKQCNKIIT